MRVFILLVIFLPLQVSSASDAETGAADTPIATSIQPLEGTGELSTKSRWHQFDRLKGQVIVDVAMTEQQLGKLFGALTEHLAEPTDSLQSHFEHLAATVPIGIRIKPTDAARFERFVGSGEVRDHTRVAKIGQSEVAMVETATQPTVRFAFDATVTTSGRYGNRFGPNSWRNIWQIKMAGQIVRDNNGRHAWQSLSLVYSVEGMFMTPGAANATETWTGKGKTELKEPNEKRIEHDAARLARTRELIDQLGAESYWQREAAETELQPLAREFRSLLVNEAADNSDAEIRMRLQRIVERIEAEKPQFPTGWFVMW